MIYRKNSVFGKDEETPFDDDDIKEHWKKDDRNMSRTEKQERENKWVEWSLCFVVGTVVLVP